MKLSGFLIVVKDIRKAEKYYHDLFGLETLVDNDGNMILSGGLVLQEEKYWRAFLDKDVIPKNNACELYFEEEDVDAFFEKLKTLYTETVVVTFLTLPFYSFSVFRYFCGTLFAMRHNRCAGRLPCKEAAHRKQNR